PDSCLQHHAAVAEPVDIHLLFPGRPFHVALGVGDEGLQHQTGFQLDVVDRMPAQVGDVVYGALYPVVVGQLQLRFFDAHQQFFRAQGEGHARVLGPGADAMADVDRPLQLRTGDHRVVFGILDQLAVEQVDVADELADQPAGGGLVDVHRAADLGDPA